MLLQCKPYLTPWQPRRLQLLQLQTHLWSDKRAVASTQHLKNNPNSFADFFKNLPVQKISSHSLAHLTIYLSFSFGDSFMHPSSSPSPPHPSHSVLHSSLHLYLHHQQQTLGSPALVPVSAAILFCCDGPSESNRQIA